VRDEADAAGVVLESGVVERVREIARGHRGSYMCGDPTVPVVPVLGQRSNGGG
jgi:hypothetical protein